MFLNTRTTTRPEHVLEKSGALIVQVRENIRMIKGSRICSIPYSCKERVNDILEHVSYSSFLIERDYEREGVVRVIATHLTGNIKGLEERRTGTPVPIPSKKLLEERQDTSLSLRSEPTLVVIPVLVRNIVLLKGKV